MAIKKVLHTYKNELLRKISQLNLSCPYAYLDGILPQHEIIKCENGSLKWHVLHTDFIKVGQLVHHNH
jgi:hypothetical protein